MNQKGLTFIEILMVCFFIILISSFTLFKVFFRKDQNSRKNTLKQIENICFMAQRKAQAKNEDIYLCFIPNQYPFNRMSNTSNPYFTRRKHLVGHSFVLAKKSRKFKKNIVLETIGDWVFFPEEIFFDDEKKKTLFFDRKHYHELRIIDSMGNIFNPQVPAIVFASRTGQVHLPVSPFVRKMLIRLEKENSMVELVPYENKIQWKIS